MKVLLLRLSSLGDVVLATSAVEALALARPDVEIDFLTKPAFGALLANNPHVRRVIEWPEGVSAGRLAATLRAERYDFVVDLHANLRTRLLRLFLRGNWSVVAKGAVRRRLALLLGRSGWLENIHVVDRYAAALAPLGVPAGRSLPRLYPTEADQAAARFLLREAGWEEGGKPLVALAPGARWATKMWPREKWLELARRCRDAGHFLAVVGGPEDGALAREIAAAAPGAVCVAAGITNLLQTTALLSRCKALVTNDSAPLHLAVAAGAPVVALFGPTVRGFGFYPLGPRDRVVENAEPCRPCRLHGGDACPKGHLRCLEAITADEVFAALEDVLAP